MTDAPCFPNYTLTPATTHWLMEIETARAVVEHTHLPPQVAQTLGLSECMARILLQEWVANGWLQVADPSQRKRAYTLSAIKIPETA